MTLQVAPSPSFADQFAAARRRLPGAGLPWMDSLREEAIARFRQSGFPTPKLEAWKFTNLDRLARTGFETGGALSRPTLTRAALAPYRLTPECHLLALVHRPFSRELSQAPHLPRRPPTLEFPPPHDH